MEIKRVAKILALSLKSTWMTLSKSQSWPACCQWRFSLALRSWTTLTRVWSVRTTYLTYRAHLMHTIPLLLTHSNSLPAISWKLILPKWSVSWTTQRLKTPWWIRPREAISSYLTSRLACWIRVPRNLATCSWMTTRHWPTWVRTPTHWCKNHTSWTMKEITLTL